MKLIRNILCIVVTLSSLLNLHAARSKETPKKTAASKPQSQVMKKEAPFKPARGRGRHAQLKKMTPQERRAEAEWRLQKNREAAKACRENRKAHVEELEAKVAEYEARLQTQEAKIAVFRKQIKCLRAQLEDQGAPALRPLTTEDVTEALASTILPDSADLSISASDFFNIESITTGSAAGIEAHIPHPSHVLPAIWLGGSPL